MRRLAGLAAVFIALISLVTAGLVGTAAAQETSPSPQAPTPTVEGQYATINGAKLYYELHGPEDGPPLLLLHGSLSNIYRDWTNQIPAFAAAGYRVVAFDARAQGRSTWGDSPTIPQMALDAEGLLDHLGIAHADVVGWSRGGDVALELAVNQADRLDRVVVYGGMYDAAGNLPEIRFSDEMPPFELWTGDYQRLSPEPERMQEFLDFDAANPRNFSEAELGSITVPVLVLDGAEEEFYDTAYTKRMAALIPGSQLVLMPGTGHFAPLVHTEEFNRIVLAFLAGEEVGPSTSHAA